MASIPDFTIRNYSLSDASIAKRTPESKMFCDFMGDKSEIIGGYRSTMRRINQLHSSGRLCYNKAVSVI